MTDQAAVVTDESVPPTKVPRRRRRNDHHLWSLRDALNMVINELQKMNERLDKLGAQSDTQRKLSEAGKKSAEARRKKFGSAKPTAANPTEVVIPAGAIPPQAGGTNLLGEPVLEPVRVPAKKKQPSEGSAVWEAYELAYQQRHNVSPIRNLKVNAQCKSLVAQVGVQEACALVRYYVGRNDAFYLNAKHPLGLLLIDLQKLRTEYATGQSMTMRDARRQEVHTSTDQSIREYAATQGALE